MLRTENREQKENSITEATLIPVDRRGGRPNTRVFLYCHDNVLKVHHLFHTRSTGANDDLRISVLLKTAEYS